MKDFTNIKYIKNAGYYKANPLHAKQKKAYNNAGTCTTVAFQLFLGYHNYYSDRRLIPEKSVNGRRFLGANYGDILENPIIDQSVSQYEQWSDDGTVMIQRGKQSLGTDVSVYDEIYDLTMWSDVTGIGQNIYFVAKGAIDFLEKYASEANNLVIFSDTYTESEVKYEIDMGNPVVLGRSRLKGSNDYHVVNAYGYANYRGEFGYIVHCGWGTTNYHSWIPASQIGYQSLAHSSHKHTLVDTGNIVANAYRELVCTTCGYNTPVDLYETSEDGKAITKLNFPVDGDIVIPKFINDIRIDKIADGVFANSDITSVNLGMLQEIGDGAFENCKSLTNITSTSYLTSIGNSAFKGCESLREIYLSAKVTNIGKRAFEGCNSLDISATKNIFSVNENIIYNFDRTEILHTGHISQSLVIPDTVKKVAPYAFASNINLEYIRFNGEPELGENAFADCSNLRNVYFDSFSPPQFGENLFANDYFTIYVPYNAQDEYKATLPKYATNIQSVQITVLFISDGQVTKTMPVYNGSTINNLPIIDKDGYNFNGWYDNPECVGSPIPDGEIWRSENDIELYAKWTPKKYTVTLDPNGGVLIGNGQFQATFDDTFATTASATLTGHGLEGWYDKNDVKYITAEGNCTQHWNKTNDTILFAKWYVKSYEIQITDERTIVWLSKDGLSGNPCYIQYGTVIDAVNLIKIFKNSAQGYREGKIFDCFRYADADLNWTTIPDLGDDKSVVTIVPIWVNEVHTIYFNALCNIAVPEIQAEYDSAVILPNTIRTGYVLNGWYTDSAYDLKVTWEKMPDLTPHDQNNGSTTLFAKWSPIGYTVKYDLNGYSGSLASTRHTYDKSDNLRYYAPSRTGYNFKGWATTKNGDAQYSDGQSVINLTTINNSTVTLYAVWSPISYFFTFKNLIDGMYGSVSYYTYGEGLTTMPTLRMRPAQFAQAYDYPYFYGWYTSASFTTEVTSISKTQTGDMTLYAKYDYLLTTVNDSNTRTVTDAGTNNNPYLSVGVYLKSFNYNLIKDTTLNKIRIEFSFDMWKINDGYQHVYVRYVDSMTEHTNSLMVVAPTIVWSKKLDIGDGKYRKSYVIELDLEKYKDIDSFYVLFDASGAGSDTWKFSNFELKAYLTN